MIKAGITVMIERKPGIPGGDYRRYKVLRVIASNPPIAEIVADGQFPYWMMCDALQAAA